MALAITLTGLWFQNLSLTLMVVEVTGTASAMGWVTFAQFLPLLILSVPAGVISDRKEPRLILLWTTASSALVAAIIAVNVFLRPSADWYIYALVAVLGAIATFERAASQALIYETVGTQKLGQAVAISTTAIAIARSVGPGLAGIVFHAFGAGIGVGMNALAFVIAHLSVRAIDKHKLYSRETNTDTSPIRLRSVLRNYRILTLLLVNGFVSLLALNLQVIVTAIVVLDFGGNALATGGVHSLSSIGGVVGGVFAASIRRMSLRYVALASSVLGLSLLITSLTPELHLLYFAAPVLGAGVGYYQAVTQQFAQQSVPPYLIGRLMSLINVGSYGTYPFGAILLTWVIDQSSGQFAMSIGALAAFLAAGFVLVIVAIKNRPPRHPET